MRASLAKFNLPKYSPKFMQLFILHYPPQINLN